MANTKKYLSHLLQNTGITPACSEEERAAADVIAKIFADHGFAPEIQEFSASGMPKVVQAGLGIVAFVGAVLAGIGGAVGVIGLLLSIAAAVLFVLERTGKPVLSGLGSGGLSQNVIAYHKASGPLASPRNRPVVVVAHYDSPREDLLAREPFAAYRPMIVKLLPFAMVAPAVLCVVRILPVPDAAKVVMWILAIVAALIPLTNGVAIIANRFVLPYTTGAVSNKSSVAAMLGVMDAVAPYELGEEFPHDTPADEYFAEQQRILEEAIAEAEAAAAAQAEAAMAYPHELEDAEGVEDVDAESAEDASEEGKPGDDVVDLGSTSTMAAADLAAGVTGVMTVADETGVMPAASETGVMSAASETGVMPAAGETGVMSVADVLDMDATVTSMPAPEDDETPLADVAVTTEDAPLASGANGADGEQTAMDLDSVEPEEKLPFYLNAAGNVRFGADTIRGLGMLPASCAVVYEAAPEDEVEQLTAFDAPAHDVFYSDEPVAASELAKEPSFVEAADVPAADDAVYDEEPAEEYEPSYEDDEVLEVEAEEAAPEDFDVILEAEYEVIEDDESEGEAAAELDVSSEDAPAFDSDEAVFEDDEDDLSEDGLDKTVAASPLMQDAALFEDDQDDMPFEMETPAGSLDWNDVDDEPVEASSEETSAPAPEAASESAPDLSSTVAMPLPTRPADTVDSLMAEIDRVVPAHPQRTINVPSTADAPTPHTPASANRAALFDLPDPSATPVDPFAAFGTAQFDSVAADDRAASDDAAAEARSAFTVISSPAPAVQPAAVEQPFETISAPAPAPEKPRRGIGRLFGRKKKNDDSMSEWLGVDDSYDAKINGHDIGSWDNFDDDGWKGGAAGFDGATEEELREAVADMGDDELLGHDIWFVATGASENGNAGIRAFLDTHRDKLRGVFLINLESVGAGQVAMLATEGEQRVLKGDKRIMKLVQRVSADFHHEYPAVDMPYVTTDAHAAMSMSLRSLTLGGVEGTGFALSHTEEDQPYNIDTDNVALVSDVVTEVIRRS